MSSYTALAVFDLPRGRDDVSDHYRHPFRDSIDPALDGLGLACCPLIARSEQGRTEKGLLLFVVHWLQHARIKGACTKRYEPILIHNGPCWIRSTKRSSTSNCILLGLIVSGLPIRSHD